MESEVIFYGMGWRAGCFSLAKVSESGSERIAADIWAMPWGGSPVLPREEGGVKIGRVENDLSARAQPIGTDEDASTHRRLWHIPQTEGVGFA